MDKNWVYFGPFRPKIDPKMVSYNITFTKKWFFMPSFHLFTQIRIILDYHVWDHFCTKRNLNKQIWVFWAPVFEKKSNWIRKNIFCSFSLSINPSSISLIRSNPEFLILHIYVEFAMGRIQISGLLLYLRDQACIIPYHPKNAIFHHFKGKTMSYGSWLAVGNPAWKYYSG